MTKHLIIHSEKCPSNLRQFLSFLNFITSLNCCRLSVITIVLFTGKAANFRKNMVAYEGSSGINTKIKKKE